MTLSNFIKPIERLSKIPNFTLNDLILDNHILEQINICINKIKHYDKLYNEWELSKIDKKPNGVIINFYGMPGTGKTIAAEAMAHLFNKSIIEVNYSELFSELMGKSSKNLHAFFKAAYDENSLLFFDEADSILSKRSGNSNSSDSDNNVTKSVMLRELDKFDGIVIFATNYFENYDNAFFRRILAHIEFKLPDIENRKKILQYMLSKKIPGRNELDFDVLAEKSNDLSGGEMKNSVIKTLAKISDLNLLTQKDLEDEFENCKRSKNYNDIAKYLK